MTRETDPPVARHGPAPAPDTTALRQGTTARSVSRTRAPLHRGTPRPLPRVARWLRILGPGLITGAADDDPSGIGTYSQAGAAFGTGQLWLAFYMLPLMIAVQEMCGRIGLVTGNGIAAVVRQRYNRVVLLGAVLLVFVANTLNIGADLGAMAATLQLFLPSVPSLLLVVVIALGILLLEVFVPYHRYALVLKVLALSLLAYVVTGLIVGGEGGVVLRATLIPSVERTPAFLALVVGVLGTTISPYLFFWQASEEVEEVEDTEKHAAGTAPNARTHASRADKRNVESHPTTLRRQIRSLRVDTVLGMITSEVATWFIIFTTGSVLHPHGITTITSADQAAAALQPLVQSFPHAGVLAGGIFALGILGVGLLGVPVLAGSAAYAVAEALHWREGLAKTVRQARGFYGVIALATLVGVALNLFHVNPMAALVYTAIINGVVAVPLLVLILLVANNRAIMGEHTNGRLANIVGLCTTLAMSAAVVATLVSFFF